MRQTRWVTAILAFAVVGLGGCALWDLLTTPHPATVADMTDEDEVSTWTPPE